MMWCKVYATPTREQIGKTQMYHDGFAVLNRSSRSLLFTIWGEQRSFGTGLAATRSMAEHEPTSSLVCCILCVLKPGNVAEHLYV